MNILKTTEVEKCKVFSEDILTYFKNIQRFINKIVVPDNIKLDYRFYELSMANKTTNIDTVCDEFTKLPSISSLFEEKELFNKQLNNNLSAKLDEIYYEKKGYEIKLDTYNKSLLSLRKKLEDVKNGKNIVETYNAYISYKSVKDDVDKNNYDVVIIQNKIDALNKEANEQYNNILDLLKKNRENFKKKAEDMIVAIKKDLKNILDFIGNNKSIDNKDKYLQAFQAIGVADTNTDLLEFNEKSKKIGIQFFKLKEKIERTMPDDFKSMTSAIIFNYVQELPLNLSLIRSYNTSIFSILIQKQIDKDKFKEEFDSIITMQNDRDKIGTKIMMNMIIKQSNILKIKIGLFKNKNEIYNILLKILNETEKNEDILQRIKNLQSFSENEITENVIGKNIETYNEYKTKNSECNQLILDFDNLIEKKNKITK